MVAASRCTLLLASGEAPNQRQAAKLEGSSVQPSTTVPLVQEQLASTPPIGTAWQSWLRLGWERGTIARRGLTPAGANDLGRREAHILQREGIPSVAPRKQIPLRHPISQLASPPTGPMTHALHTYTSACSRSYSSQQTHPVCVYRVEIRSIRVLHLPGGIYPLSFRPIYPAFVCCCDSSL